MPAGMHHYAWTSEDTVFQLNVLGHRTATYVNPADDPLHQSHTHAVTRPETVTGKPVGNAAAAKTGRPD